MIKVMVVDDSAVYRMLLSKALKACEGIEVVGVAVDGQDAIDQLAQLKPDVVTLDMHMPRMNGMETLQYITAKYPSIQVVVVAAETANDAERAVAILEAGAFEVVIKPKSTDPSPMQVLCKQLYPRIQAAYERKSSLHKGPATTKRTAARSYAGFSPDIVAIGSSTGGPAALLEVLKCIPRGFLLPIVVVQHMPKLFVESLAARLNRDIPLTCTVAEEGMQLKPGGVYFAPGEVHMDVERAAGGNLVARLHQSPPEHHCRPAVDVTLRSLSRLSPHIRTLVVILTGMGSDGALGAKELLDRGARVIVQDEQSSVVWGMPGATVKLGAANEVLPLAQVGDAIVRIAGGTS